MRATPVAIEWHPRLSIYASEQFLRAVGDQYGWIAGIDEFGRRRCILPYTIVRKAMFRMARFRVETIPIGEPLEIDEEKAFLNGVVAYLRSIGADMIIPATTNTIFRTCPDGAIAAPYGSYVIDLTLSEEALWANLNSSHRRKVRLAIKGGVEISDGIEHLELAYGLIRETFKRSGLGFMGIDAFRRYVLGLKENVRVFVATREGSVQGCLVVPFSEHCAYYVYGGSVPSPLTGATNLLHWEVIRRFRGLGVQRYDFVGVRMNPDRGSKQEGLKLYKERFGGKLVQGYMWKYSFNPLKFAAYSIAVRLRSRSGDIVDQERSKVATSWMADSPGSRPSDN